MSLKQCLATLTLSAFNILVGLGWDWVKQKTVKCNPLISVNSLVTAIQLLLTC